MRLNKHVGLLVFLLIASVFLLQQSIAAESEAREWESGDGKYKVTATFKEFNEKENKVVLVKKDGKEVTVPVAKLSKKDQDHIKKIAGNKKSDVDSFGQDDDTPPTKPDDKQTEKKSTDTPQPRDADTKPDPVAEAKEPEPLSAEDEKLAQDVYKQFIAAELQVKQPKWEKVWSVKIDSSYSEVDFSRDGNLMAAINAKKDCELRSLVDGKIIKSGDRNILGDVEKVAISPDGKYILNARSEKKLTIWEVESGKEVFQHKAGDDKTIHQVSLNSPNEKVAILSEGCKFWRFPQLGGEGNEVSENLPDDRIPDRFAASPDFKKFLLWKQTGQFNQCFDMDLKQQGKSRSGFSRSLPQRSRMSGGVCTNDYFVSLDHTGKLWFINTDFAPDKEGMWLESTETTIAGNEVSGVNSGDAKFAAIVSVHGIMAFPSNNPGMWKTFAIPPVKIAKRQIWLLPDFERVVIVEQSGMMSLWKSDLRSLITDAPLLRELVQKKKFEVLDRAYILMGKDKSSEKYGLIQPCTRIFLLMIGDEIGVANLKEGSTHYADFHQWRKKNPSNSIASIIHARDCRQLAWRARGSGLADTVTQEGWKVFHERLLEARQTIEPLLKREHIPAEALYYWMEICQGVSWNGDDVALGIQGLLRDHPLHGPTYHMTAFSLLPRWHGAPGEAEKFAEMVSDKADPAVKDAIYLNSTRGLMTPRRMAITTGIFDDEKNPARFYDGVKLDSDRLLSGADQIASLIPDHPAGPTLGLYYSIQSSNKDAARKYLKTLDDKFSGIVSPYCGLTMVHVYYTRMELSKD